MRLCIPCIPCIPHATSSGSWPLASLQGGLLVFTQAFGLASARYGADESGFADANSSAASTVRLSQSSFHHLRATFVRRIHISA